MKTILGIFVVLGFAVGVNAQYFIEWEKNSGIAGNDQFNDIIEVEDGNFVAVGSKDDHSMLVVKFDQHGSILWEKEYAENNPNTKANAVVRASNGGYIIVGQRSFGNTEIDGYMLRIDEEGNVVWDLPLGENGIFDAINGVVRKSGYYLLVGTKEKGNGNSGFEIFTMGVTSFGLHIGGSDILLENALDSEIASAIISTSTGYAIVGKSEKEYLHPSDGLILMLDNGVNLLRRKVLGGEDNDSFYDLVQDTNGDLVIAGYSESQTGHQNPNQGQEDCWIAKTNSNGDLLSSFVYGGSSSEEANSIIRNNRGNFVIGASSWSSDGDVSENKGRLDGWLFEINSEGDLIWEKTFGGSQDDGISSIIEVGVGEYVFAGSTRSSDGDISGGVPSLEDGWVVKVGLLKANPYTLIDGGRLHSLMLCEDGLVYATGSNAFGQLGDGTNTTSYQPVQVENLDNVISISAGNFHSMALTASGELYSWGDNDKGQLGLSPLVIGDKNSPFKLITSGRVAISAGNDFSLALKADGTILAFGNNNKGQLGGGHNDPTYFEAVEGVTNAVAIQAGKDHSLALLEDGTVMAWGNNSSGELGDGNFNNSYVPVPVVGLTNVIAIGAGEDVSFATKADGSFYSWGRNNRAQLGLGYVSNTRVDEPQLVPDVDAIVEIDAGFQHTVARRFDGSVYSCGFPNTKGELGNGTTNGSYEFVRVDLFGGVSDVDMMGIGSGQYHTLAASRSGVGYGAGRNHFGQITGQSYQDGPTPSFRELFNMVCSIGSIYEEGAVSPKESSLTEETNTFIVSEYEVSVYPNPFTNHVSFEFTLLTDDKISLVIYDMYGKQVQMTSQDLASGSHRLTWEPSEDFSTGVYFYQLNINGGQQGKLMLVE